MNTNSDRDLDHLVESYRVMLGLKTWDEQTSWAQKIAGQHGISYTGRRSGRTTRGILRAIARATLDSVQTIAVDANTKAILDDCLFIGNHLLRGLGLDRTIRMAPDRPGIALREPVVYYADHANKERP